MPRTSGGYLFYDIGVGFRGRTLMPHSEVCMHMKIAGKYMDFEILDRGVQLFVTDDETPRYSQCFSSPILLGEAGLKETDESNQTFFYLPHLTQLPNDPLASEPPHQDTDK